MTILDFLKGKRINRRLLDPILDVIKDSYSVLVNDNYQLTVDNEGEVLVKIPSLQKKDEFEYKKITEYDYPMIMCMRISENYNVKHYEYITKNFLEIYQGKLDLLFDDVNSIEELKNKVKSTKKRIEYTSYVSISGIILQTILLIVFNNMSSITKSVIVLGTILLFLISLSGQLTKDKQVKNLIDGYIIMLKTSWYKEQITKQYVFLCNIIE